MSQPTIEEFTNTPAGTAFYRAYDAVLGRWPDGTTPIDLESEYGNTRINAYGPPDAPPVVLLPGGGATSTVWFANVAALGARHRVHAVDILGDAGRSVPGPRPPRTVDDLLDWFFGVVDGLGLDTFGVAGHSYGAMIALAAALRRPERVGKLVLLDPNSCFSGMRPGYLLRALPVLLRPSEQRERAFVVWETGGRPLDEEWLDLLALGATFPTSKTIVPKRPSAKAFHDFGVDTTVILARDSKVHDSRRVDDAVRRLLPGARTIVLDDATHHTLPVHPADAVNAALLEGFGALGGFGGR